MKCSCTLDRSDRSPAEARPLKDRYAARTSGTRKEAGRGEDHFSCTKALSSHHVQDAAMNPADSVNWSNGTSLGKFSSYLLISLLGQGKQCALDIMERQLDLVILSWPSLDQHASKFHLTTLLLPAMSFSCQPWLTPGSDDRRWLPVVVDFSESGPCGKSQVLPFLGGSASLVCK